MKISLIFNDVPPFSINKANYRNGNRTAQYRNWCANIHKIIQLPENYKKLRELEKHFIRNKHCLDYTIKHYIPSSIFYTAKGEKSIKTKDISNIEKPLIDAISSSRYKKKYDIPVLDIDDKFVKRMSSEFIAHDSSYRIVVDIEIIPN